MKKLLLVVAFGAAGLVSAKNAEITNEAKETEAISTMFFYHPITLTSSCGYTQTVEVGPLDQPDCWMTDLQQMEDECSAPFTNPLMGMW
jgi:hypothetical protein